MVKIKVFELAKELNIDSKDIILKLKKMGYEVRSHMSTLDDPVAEKIRMQKDSLSSRNETTEEKPGSFVPKVTRIPKSTAVETVTSEQISETETKAGPEEKAAETVSQHVTAQESPASLPSQEKETAPVKPESITKENIKRDIPPASGENAAKVPYTKAADKYIPRPKQPYTPGTGSDRPRTDGTGGYQRPPQGNRQDRPAQRFNKPGEGTARPPFKPYDKPGVASAPRTDAKKPFPPRDFRKDQPGKFTPGGDKPPFGKKPLPKGKDEAVNALVPPKININQQKDKSKKNYEQDHDSHNKNFRSIKKKYEDQNSDRPIKGHKPYKGRRDEKKDMPPVVPKKVIIGETIVLGELAKSMGKTAAEVIKKLFAMGIMATINQEIDADTAILIADEYNVTVEVAVDKAAEIMEDVEDDEKHLKERPPVVTVMGHVDHGKTSLLDAIRKTNVIATEAGGITQHIGAYQVEINGKRITFLDTPGHEAFTAMRARGAQITDIAIIVVAADDGVMPQTIEAINHSKAAGVPIIVAINKMDKPGANPDRVKQELTEQGLLAEDWGGDTVMVPVSAKQGTGIETLLEMILLVAEVAELKANPKRQARGTVVEAKLDKARGPIATLLVQKGTLNLGDSILAGAVFGKVKAMNDDKGRKVKSAGPSFPVEVLGFSDVPPAGEIFLAVKDDKDARLVAYKQQLKKREDELHKSAKVSLDDLFKQISEGEIKELNLVIKADVQGSIEALVQALNKLNTEEVKVKIIHAGVGGINDTDVMLASASNAIIIGFNVRPEVSARKSADQENIDIRLYRVIYDATDDIRKAMSGLLAPEVKEVVIGHAQVRSVFKVPKAGMVAGCYVTDGKITRSAQVRVIRDSVVVCESTIESLRRFKDDAKEVLSGFECGIDITNFNDIKENDVIEAFIMEEIKRQL